MDKDFKRAENDVWAALYWTDIVNIFKKYKPQTRYDIKRMGFSLKKLGEGIYREGYKIKGFPLVVKIPLEETGQSGITHAREEFRKLKLLSKSSKYRALKSFIPKILYFDSKTGIALMPEYTKLPEEEGLIVANVLSSVAYNLNRPEGGDFHEENIGRDENGKYVIFDLGYF